MKIRVKIDRIVLEGASANQRNQAELRGAIEAELSRLLRSNRVAPKRRTTDRVVAASALASNSDQPGKLGKQLASHIHRAVLGTKG
jgi:hypothetical protein